MIEGPAPYRWNQPTEEAELHQGSIPELRHDVREILIAAGVRQKSSVREILNFFNVSSEHNCGIDSIDDLVETLISRFVTGKR